MKIMPINLNSLVVEVPDITQFHTDTITTIVPAGKELKVETTPGGEELASGIVPDGKKWSIKVVISIVESNA